MIDLLNWGLRTGVVITGLIGLVLLLLRPFAHYFGAEATFLLWSLPLIRLCLPDMHMRVKSDHVTLPYDRFPMWGGGDIAASIEALSPPNPTEPAMSSIALSPDVIIAGVVTLWIGGAILWLGFHWMQHIRYGRLLRHVSADCPDSLRQTIVEAAKVISLRKLPEVKIAPKNIGPLVSGVFRPVIILPNTFEVDYSTEAQSFSLVHEFAHIKRRDLWAALIALIFRAVNWYNPLAHYASRKFRADLEAACDAYTLSCFAGDDRNAHEYALTLLLAAPGINPKIPTLSLALKDNFDGASS